ncbi:uncharacterized protein [Erythrolamprus reginae]|uniref:uncharacterized protein n=1 Tax=Erythrolamprus reginae TaxID=121349 RepID=UPI00396CA2C9
MGKFLLTGSIVILLILLQTEKIVSRVRFPFRNPRPLFPNRPFKPGNLPVNKPAYSYSFKPRSEVPPPPPPRDNRQGYPFIFRKPGDLPSFWDNLRNAAPPPPPPPQRDSPPSLFRNLGNYTSFWDKLRNVAPPPRNSPPSLFRNLGNYTSFWDKLRNVAPPPRNSPPSLFRNLGNYTSFCDKLRNAAPPPRDSPPSLFRNLPKLKDKIEAANEFAEANQGFHTFSSSSEGGNSRSHDGNPEDSKPKGDEVKYIVGETVRNAPVEDPESYIIGSPIAKMDFRFNDSEEERWWNENRHRFATHVYHPNSSQPISRDVFLNECVNVTIGEYVKPTGNQTEDELEARVVTQVANGKCMEMYPRLTVLTTAGSYYNNKPEGATILEIKSEFRYGEGVALANSLGRASGHNPQNNAVSDLHFSFENALFLIHPFAISVITLIIPFLIF